MPSKNLKTPHNDAPVAKLQVHGRGAMENPTGRYEKLTAQFDGDAFDARAQDEEENLDDRRIETQIFHDSSRSVVATNDSPDVGFEASLNPYRGCEHGCIYCFARPSHEYFGLSAGLDFETKIFAKPDAPRLLREKLSSKSWQPKPLILSGVTDCYQPIERKLKITRACFEVLRDFRNPAAIITKNQLVTRDIDIFKEMAEYDCIAVNISLTTLDDQLARVMEPRASQPRQKLRAIEALAKAKIPVRIMMGPVIPGLTDHEIPAVLKAAADAGATGVGYTILRLPYGVKDLFQTWLQQHYPDRAQKILNRLKDMRGGKLNDPRFGNRMGGEGVYAEQIAQIFTTYKKRYGLDKERRPFSIAHFRRDAGGAQMRLF